MVTPPPARLEVTIFAAFPLRILARGLAAPVRGLGLGAPIGRFRSSRSPCPLSRDRSGNLRSSSGPELTHDPPHVVGHGRFSDRQLPCDLGVGEPIRNQRRDLPLARRSQTDDLLRRI